MTYEELIEKGESVYSFSRLSTLHHCLQEYKLGYINSNSGSDNIWSKLGSLIHDCLEKIHNDELPESEFANQYILGLNEILSDGYKFPNDAIKENTFNSLEHYIRYFKKSKDKCENERYFLTNLNGIWIRGYIDKLVYNDDGTVDVYDYKISTKFSKKDMKEKGHQLVLYAYAMEQLGMKVNKVYWNMLKYVNIYWSKECGRKINPLTERKNVWNNLHRDRLMKACELSGEYTSEQAYELWIKLSETNSLDIPDNIKKYITIEEGYVEYEYNDETRQGLFDFVQSSVDILKEEKDFKPLTINNSNSFYCSNLCGQRNNCSAYINYVESLPQNMLLDSGDMVDLGDFFK